MNYFDPTREIGTLDPKFLLYRVIFSRRNWLPFIIKQIFMKLNKKSHGGDNYFYCNETEKSGQPSTKFGGMPD